MKQPVFFTAGDTQALRQARNQLLTWGYEVSSTVSEYVTHLLLPVPSFERPGILKGGQPFDEVMAKIPPGTTVMGGFLPDISHKAVDFLKDEYYLTENAAITAVCTMRFLQHRAGSLSGLQALVIGWGRIGKQLIPLLKAKGANVSAAVRKDSDLKALRQLGITAVSIGQWRPQQYHIIINTAPAPVLDEGQTSPHALLIDLASVRGISGDRVIWARGLPNQDAPDLSGILIAKTALRYALGKESV